MDGYSLLLSLVLGVLVTSRSVSSNCDDYDSYDYDPNNPCVITTCGVPILVHGTIRDVNGNDKDSYNVGEEIRASCDRDYVLHGPAEATCQDDHTWSWSAPPTCNPKPPPEPLCTTQIDLKEGMTITSVEMKANSTFYRKIVVACEEDYRLYGTGIYVCEGANWKGHSVCVRKPLCPKINAAPRNGFVTLGDLSKRNVGDEIHFGCQPGYILMGDRIWKCLPSLVWRGMIIYCEEDRGLIGRAIDIRENIIDKYAENTVTGSNRGRLSASNVNGIELFFLIDRSDSISSDDFTLAKRFITTLVDLFGVSSKGGATRLMVISIGSNAKVELSFDQIEKMEDCVIKAKQAGKNIMNTGRTDQWANKCINFTADPLGSYKKVEDCVQKKSDVLPAGINRTEILQSLKELVKRKISAIPPSGGGTNIGAALTMLRKVAPRCNAEKSVFLLSDGRDNINQRLDALMQGIRTRVDEIFTIGIGQDVNVDQLKLIASKPIARHVFELKDFKELDRLGELLITKNDYNDCGVSSVQRTNDVRLNKTLVQEAKPRSWPWLVKISKEAQGFPDCIGTLIAKNYVLTAATCVYANGSLITSKLGPTEKLLVTAGYFVATTNGSAPGEKYAAIINIKVHTDFKLNNPRKNNIALLKIEDVQPGPYVRTICLPGTGDNILFTKAQTRWLVGWNSSTSNPYATLTDRPYERTMKLYSKQECIRQHPYTRGQSYHQCLGDRYAKRGHCAGDKGAPIMVQDKDIDGKPIYKVVAIVEDGTECMEPRKFTVVTEISNFLSWILDEIKN